MESGNSAAGSAALVCTCGPDLLRNGGYVHNYVCPMTPKCMHLIPRINYQTGETEQRPCGSRLEPQYASHCHGCPCLPLCPHCGTSMDRRGVHSIGCPNRSSYSFENPGNLRDDFLDGIQSLRRYYHEQPNLLNVMRVMPVITARNPVSPPSIIDGDFEVNGQCSICHDECELLQQIMKPSECDHCFHSSCLTPWIEVHSTCPNCRVPIQSILRKN